MTSPSPHEIPAPEPRPTEPTSSSPPWPSDWPGEVVAAPAIHRTRPSSSARVLVRVSAALLTGSLLAMGVGAAPAVARELGLSSVNVVHRPWPKSSPQGRAGSDAVRSQEARRSPFAPGLDELDEELPLDALEPPKMQAAITRRAVPVRALPLPGAELLGELRAGESVLVLRAQGEQRLTVRSGPPDTLLGWVDASDLEAP